MVGLVLTIKEASVKEIQRIQQQPKSMTEFLQSKRNRLDLDKAWHGIHFMLTGKAYEADGPESYLMMGGTALAEISKKMGPARSISAQEARNLYEVMCAISIEDLKERYQPKSMGEIYPGFWDPALDGEDFPYLVYYFEKLKEFLAELVEKNYGAVVFVD